MFSAGLRAKKSLRIFARFLVVFLTALSAGTAAADFTGPREASPHAVTIETVYLKNGDAWQKILSPDRKVDLSVEEPSVFFFNNGGRVPEGNYRDFRVDFYRDGSGGLLSLSLQRPLEKPVRVAPGSFVRIDFKLDLTAAVRVTGATLIVDEDERQFSENELQTSPATRVEEV